jgi:hypothetical protein
MRLCQNVKSAGIDSIMYNNESILKTVWNEGRRHVVLFSEVAASCQAGNSSILVRKY